MPEEILNHLPHLKLAQMSDALSFYLDNQAEIAVLNETKCPMNQFILRTIRRLG
jgi:hypothetical protein